MTEVVSEAVAEERQELTRREGPPDVPLVVQMREEIPLRVAARPEQGKGPVGRLRREAGMLPGVLYGHKQVPLPFKLEDRMLQHALRRGGQNAVFMVEVEGSDEPVQRAVVREIQYHKVRGDVLHVDLLRIDPEEQLRVSVPLVTRGTALGVREGGALQQSLAEVELLCLASELPSRLEIDVSDLIVGDSVHVSDLVERESRILTDADRVIVSVLAPRLATEDEEAEEEEVEGEAEEGEEGAEEAPASEGEGEGEGEANE